MSSLLTEEKHEEEDSECADQDTHDNAISPSSTPDQGDDAIQPRYLGGRARHSSAYTFKRRALVCKLGSSCIGLSRKGGQTCKGSSLN